MTTYQATVAVPLPAMTIGSEVSPPPTPEMDLSAWIRQGPQAWLRTFGFRAPLSGDVVQDLADPALLRDQAQLGFVNITTARAGDPALEQRIITEVASYGRQLGRLIDAVGVLVAQQDRTDLTAEDQHALNQLQDLAEQITATKAEAAAERIDHIVADVRALRAAPDTNREALRRVRAALEDGSEPRSSTSVGVRPSRSA